MAIEPPRRHVAESLRGLCGGAVLLPGDHGYDAARAAGNLTLDQRPAAVAYPVDHAEVADVVRAGAQAGLRVAPQGTGHNAGPLGDLHDVIVLRTSGMMRVAVDAGATRARVQAGARWADAVEVAGAHGLVPLHGDAATVGIVGYSLGGGIGWYARAFGQQSTSIIAAELVTADGVLVRADAHHDPDLFWALRGGGGNFGIVTALEFALYPVREAYAGMLAWDWRQTGQVLDRWARWAADAPETVTTSFRIQQVPSHASVPGPLRGRRLAAIEGAVLGDGTRASALLAPLRELRPEIDTFATIPTTSVIQLSAFLGEPAPVVADSMMLSELPPAAVERFVDAAGPGSGSPLWLAELRQLGGALSRPHPDGGALSSLDGQFLLRAAAVADTPQAQAQGLARTRGVISAMAPYATGSRYLNFATRPVDVSTGYHPDAWKRMQDVRAAVDPNQLFVANHSVPPAKPV